jgi:hypothetical protein
MDVAPKVQKVHAAGYSLFSNSIEPTTTKRSPGETSRSSLRPYGTRRLIAVFTLHTPNTVAEMVTKLYSEGAGSNFGQFTRYSEHSRSVPQFFEVNVGVVPLSRSRQLASKFLPIQYSLLSSTSRD